MRIFVAYVLCLFAFMYVAFFAVSAFAADGTVPAVSVLDVVRPYIAEIASVLVLAFVTWLSSWLRATFKVSLDEAHRKALHSALENGARLAVEKLDTLFVDSKVPVGHPLVAEGVEYVLKYSPDAVAYFGLTPERVGELLRAKLIVPVGG